MDVDDALRRLRAADPAAGTEGTWSGSAAERRTQHRPAPPTATRRRAMLPAVAAAAVVVAVAIGASVLYRSNVVTGHGSALQSSSGPRGRADALLSDLLAAVPVLPGAVQRAKPPTSALAQAPSVPASPNALDEHMWWTAPGSPDAAFAYFRSHPPRGTTLSGSGSGSTSQWLSFDRRDTGFARDIGVQISVVGLASGVAIRADAQAIWIPARDPDAVIVGVSSVTVTVVRSSSSGIPGAPTVTRTLTGSDAQTLAHVASTLPVPTPGTYSCPAQLAGVTDTLEFATSSGPVHVLVQVTGCGRVELVLPDQSRHSFQVGTLDRTVLRLLGLPANYGLS